MLHYADLYKQGLPPVTGGALDQAAWFRRAFAFVQHDEARAMKAK